MSNDDLMRKKIAEFIRVQRAKKQISQTELGELAGVTMRTIQKIEAGIRIKEQTINSVVKSLGYDLVWDITFEPILSNKMVVKDVSPDEPYNEDEY